MEELKPIIAKNIAALRQARGMTQQDLAAKLHYSDKAVSKWERGESVPDVAVLRQIATLFGVTVDKLLSDALLPSEAQIEQQYLHDRRIILCISLLGVACAAILAYVFFQHWSVFAYALPAAIIVWLVLNTIWLERKRNYFIISCLMWAVLADVCLLLWQIGPAHWQLMLLGIPGQVIIWLCSRIGKKSPCPRAQKPL